MNPPVAVSIIIPTGGRLNALTEALQSIASYAPGNEIIVIGNKRDEGTRRVLHESFSSVKYIESDSPSAVVKRNLGIGQATKDILVFVDDDVMVQKGWMDKLLRHYSDSTVGGVGGRVKVPGLGEGSSRFKTGVIEDGFVFGNWNPPSSAPFEVEHLLGCNMSFRRAPVVRIGGFDNFFRSYNFREETDLCLRIGQLGYRLVFDPDASLIHKALGRTKQGNRWLYFYTRNTLYLYLKYQRKNGLSLLRFFHSLVYPPKDYAALSGVRVRITPAGGLAATGGVIAGFLGYLGHRPTSRVHSRANLASIGH